MSEGSAAEPTIDLAGKVPVTDPDRRNNVTRAVFIGIAVVIIIGGAALARLVSSFGAPDESVQAMPAWTELYLNVDLKVFLDSDIGRIADTFPSLFEDPEEAEQEVLDSFAEPIQEESELDFEEDIRPWLARSIGFGMWNVQDVLDLDFLMGDSRPATNERDQVTFLVAIANRDSAAAMDALEKVATNESATEVEPIGGNRVFEFTTTDDLDEFGVQAFSHMYATVSGSLGLLSNSRYGLETAIAVQSGEEQSLRDQEEYLDTLALLPNGPGTIFSYGSAELMRAYTDATAEALEDLGDGNPYENLYDDIGGFAMSFDINDDGLRFDVGQNIGPSAFTPFGLEAMALEDPERIVSRIPDSALGYIAYVLDTDVSLYDIVESVYDETVAQSFNTPPLAESLVDVERDGGLPSGTIRGLLASIDPGLGFFVDSTTGGEIPVDVTLLLPLNNPDAARGALDELIPAMFGPDAAPTELGWAYGGEVFVGVTGDILYGTSGDVPDAADTPIAETELHQSVARALRTNYVWGFVDLNRTYDYIIEMSDGDMRESDVAAYRPITAVGLGGDVTETSASYSMVVMIDWVDD